MTKYRVALNKDRTMWFHAGADTPAETYIDIEWAETVAQQLRNGCYPDAHVVDVQQEPGKVDAHLAANPEPEPEPKYRSPMRLQRDQLREELKRAWDAIPPGIASRSDSVSAAVAKLAYAYKDNQHVADNYRAALRALPEEFRGYYALPDSVAKLAKAYEHAQAENAKLKEKLDDATHRVKQLGTRVTEFANRVVQLEDHLAAKPEPVADADKKLEAIVSAAVRRVECVSYSPSDLADALVDAGLMTRHRTGENGHYYQAIGDLNARITELCTLPTVADEEIRRVLDEMSYRVDSALMAPWSETQRWHDTLQAVAGDLVVARESLEQMTERYNLAASERTAQLQQLTRERDEAKTALDDARDRLKPMTNMRIGAEKDRDYCQSKRIEAEKERDDALSKLETIRKLTEEAP